MLLNGCAKSTVSIVLRFEIGKSQKLYSGYSILVVCACAFACACRKYESIIVGGTCLNTYRTVVC